MKELNGNRIWALALVLLLTGLSACAEEESAGNEVGTDIQEPSEDIGENLSDVMESADILDEDGGESPMDVVTDPVACKESSGCDDGNPCTVDDLCVEGACQGTLYECDDGVSCTNDICDGIGGCSFPLKGGSCRIEGFCYEDGEAHPEEPCLACVVPVATDSWSSDDNLLCDDGDLCTTGEGCSGGVCGGGASIVCNDGDLCTVDACEAEVGCISIPNSSPCDDGNPCSVGDMCSGGSCVGGGEPLVCNDGNPKSELASSKRGRDGSLYERGCGLW